MTKKERAQVVELLRCAADLEINEPNSRGCSLGDAGQHLRWDLVAPRACVSRLSLITAMGELEGVVDGEPRLVSGTGYQWLLLEAALRVEQGEWP
jgi:hypothetical protein